MIDRVKSELTAAMRAGDRSRVDALRLILSALQRAEKSVPAGEFSGRGRRGGATARAEAAARGRRELPGRRARDDRVAAEMADVPVIEEFLPAAMTDAELAALVDAAVAETGAESMRDMGRVMGLVTARGEGRVDGAAAAALVRARLSG